MQMLDFEVLSPTDCQDSSISQIFSSADTGAGEDQKICMPGKCRGVERNPLTWFQIQKLPAVEVWNKTNRSSSTEHHHPLWQTKWKDLAYDKVQHAQMLDTPEYTKKKPVL